MKTRTMEAPTRQPPGSRILANAPTVRCGRACQSAGLTSIHNSSPRVLANAPTHRAAGGFSLVETILAMGITSTALLAVLGLLSTTLGGARDSRTETAAGMLVRRAVAEARALPAIVSEASGEVEAEITLLDEALQPLLSTRQDPAQARAVYKDGSRDLRAAHIVQLRRMPLPDPADPLQTVPGVARYVITVESPANAPEGRRRVHRYVTLAAQ